MTTRTKFLALLSLPFLICMVGLYSFWSSGQAAQYVKLQGYVHDRVTGKPLDSCTIAVFNCILKKDGLYAKDNTLYARTDKDGHYEIELPNSSLMYVRVFKKGYAIAKSGAVKPQKETEQNFILEAGNDPESDLYKQGEASEIIQ